MPRPLARWLPATARRPRPFRAALEQLEDRSVPATLTDGGTSTLTITLDTANEALAVVSNGGSYTFTTNNTFADGGVASAGTDFDTFGNATITLQAAGLARYDTITVVDTAAGTTVTFNNSGANTYGDSFTVTLDDAAAGAISFNGSSSFGANSLNAATSRNISINPGASITAGNGNIMLSANQQATPSTGDFIGINMTGAATITTTGSGNISLLGRGSTDGPDFRHGVQIEGDSAVRSQGTGTVTINGTAGGTTASNTGVFLNGTNTLVSSVSGNILITGQGGTVGTGTQNRGITAVGGVTISSTGAATVTINGTGGGTGAADDSTGVDIEGATITSTGNIQITGTAGGGTGNFSRGVVIRQVGKVTATGSASVTIQGTGGAAGAFGSVGVDVSTTGSEVSAVNGGVSITAASANVSSPAFLMGAGGVVQVTGANGITLIADSMSLGGSIDAGTAVLQVRVQTTGRDINLGSDDTTTALGLTQSELNTIKAGILRFGDTGGTTNNVTVTSAISAPAGWNTLSLFTQSGRVTQNSGASITVAKLLAINTGSLALNEAGNTVSTASLLGTNTVSFVNSTSLTLDSVDPGIEAIAGGFPGGAASIGSLSITARGSGSLLTVNKPINTQNLNVGTGGDITLTADDMAINATLNGVAHVTTLKTFTPGRAIDLGTNAAGTLGLTDAELDTITASTLNIGDSTSGAISVTAAVSPANVANLSLITGGGITQTAGSTITAGGLRLSAAAPVSLNEANAVDTLAADVTDASAGFSYRDADAVTVGTVDGVSGLRTNNAALSVFNGSGLITVSQDVNAGTGEILLRAESGGVVNQAAIGNANAGRVTLRANNFDLQAGSSITSASAVNLRAHTGGVAINLGSSAAGFHLTQAELNTITAGSLILTGSSSVTVSQSITLTQVPTLQIEGGITAVIDATASEQADITVTNLALNNTDGVGAAGDGDLDLTVSTLNFTNETGDVYIANVGPLTIGAITAPFINVGASSNDGGATSISSSGALTLAAGVTSTGDISLTSGSTISVGATVSTGDITSGGTFHTGGISLTAPGGVTLNAAVVTGNATSNAGGGNATSGSISVSSTGGGLTGNASGRLVTGNATATSGATGTAQATSGSVTVNVSGAVQLPAADALTTGAATADNAGDVSTTGNVSITADKITSNGTTGQVDVKQGTAGTAPATLILGTVSATTDGGSGDAGGVFIGSGESLRLGAVTSNGGNVDIVATGLTVTGAVNSGAGRISLSGFGGMLTNQSSITSTTNLISLDADKMDLQPGSTLSTGFTVILQISSAGVNIDLGSTVDTTANTLELSQAELNTVTAAGLVLFSTASVNVSQSITLNQPTFIRGDAGITQSTAGGAPALTANSLRLGSQGGNVGTGGGLDLAVSNLGLEVNGGTVQITNSGAVNLTAVAIPGFGAVNPTSGGGSLTATGPIVINANATHTGSFTYTADNAPGTAGNSVTINNNATVTLNSATAATLTFQAGDDIVFGDATGTGKVVTTGGGNHTVVLEANREGIASGDGDDGSVGQFNETFTAVTGQGLVVRSGVGVGSASTSLVTAVSALEGASVTGGLFVKNTGDLTIGGVDATLTGLTATSSGSVRVSADSIIVTETVSAIGAGTVDLTATRNIVVSAGASLSTVDGNLTLSANQQATATSGNYVGVTINGNVTTVSGALSVAGKGGTDAAGSQYGVDVGNGATVGSTGSGAVLVTGTGGAASGDFNGGVKVSGTNSRITSGGGAVTVVGTGGGSGASWSNYGVTLHNGGLITSGGTGAVTVTGTGGAASGNTNAGVTVFTGSKVTSVGGTVTVTGVGGGTGASSNSQGVFLDSGTEISAGGSGDVVILGTGGATPGATNDGVWLKGAGTRVTSSGGSVNVTGIGGGNGAGLTNYGLIVTDGAVITAGGSGAVVIVGTGGGGAGSSTNHGVLVDGANTAITSGGGAVSFNGLTAGPGADSRALVVRSGGRVGSGGNAPLTVNADSVLIDGTSGVDVGTGTATFTVATAGRAIDLGGADTATALGLTDAELDRVTAGTLVVGGSAAGTISVSDAISRPAATSVQLVSGGSIAFAGGSVDTAGGTLQLAPGASPATVTPSTAGTDATAGGTTFTSGSRLAVVITGPTPDTGYTRLVVGGALDLTGIDLALSGGYVPAFGDSFVIAAGGSLIGTFTGLPNGAAVTFNGVDLRIFYTSTSAALYFNRAPVVSAGGPYSFNEGSGLTVSATATDPDGDALTYTWDVNGDGSFGDEVGATMTDGGRTVSFTQAQLAALGLGDGPLTRTVSVRANDSRPGGTAPATGSLTVNNVAPTISVTGTGTANEGAVYALTLGAVADPGQDTVTLFRVTWGDGTADTYTTAGPKTHTYADNGMYTITVDLTDEDGTFLNVGNLFSVTVSNVPPTITTLVVPPSGRANQPITVSAAATDPAGANDPLTFTWVVSRDGVQVASGNGASFTFTPTAAGSYTVSVTVSDGDGGVASATRTVVVPPPPSVVTAVGGVVKVTDPRTNTTTELTPFPGFLGGVRVASADLNGDGVADVVVGAGAGGSPHVRVFDGASGAELGSFFAFDPAFAGGVSVAAVAGRIVVGAGPGGGPQVKVIDAARLNQVLPNGQIADSALLASFYAFDPGFRGGVNVAAADVNRDGTVDVVLGAGAGGGAHVKVVDGTRLNEVRPDGVIADSATLANFFAFDLDFKGGVFVAATSGQITVGAGVGGGSHVKVIDAANLGQVRADGVIADSATVANFFAFDQSFTGGVRLAYTDFNADGVPDLVVGAGPGGSPHVKWYTLAPFALVRSFLAADPLDGSGVFVS